MFVLVNLGLHLGIDAESALRAANLKFTRRMGAMEDEAKAKGSRLEDMTIEELEQLWQNAKAAERSKNDKPGG
jgi:ATP diphosphatase